MEVRLCVVLKMAMEIEAEVSYFIGGWHIHVQFSGRVTLSLTCLCACKPLCLRMWERERGGEREIEERAF